MKLDNKTYDVLKWIAQIGLPALTTLYVTTLFIPCSYQKFALR